MNRKSNKMSSNYKNTSQEGKRKGWIKSFLLMREGELKALLKIYLTNLTKIPHLHPVLFFMTSRISTAYLFPIIKDLSQEEEKRGRVGSFMDLLEGVGDKILKMSKSKLANQRQVPHLDPVHFSVTPRTCSLHFFYSSWIQKQNAFQNELMGVSVCLTDSLTLFLFSIVPSAIHWWEEFQSNIYIKYSLACHENITRAKFAVSKEMYVLP